MKISKILHKRFGHGVVALLFWFAGASYAEAQSPEAAVLADDQEITEPDSPQSASERAESPQEQRRGPGGFGGGRQDGIYKARVTPNWFADNTKFWYRNDLAGGAREFILVDAERGTRQPAFDHDAVAQQIGGGADAKKLPVDELKFSTDGAAVTLTGPGQTWVWDLKTGKLSGGEPASASATGEALAADTRVRPSARTGPETEITFINRTAEEVQVFWLDEQGARQAYGSVEARNTKAQHTYGGHVWLIADQRGETLAVFEASDRPGSAVIGGAAPEGRERPTPRTRSRPEPSNHSPDGKWTVAIKESNVFIRDTDGHETQLSTDGQEGNSYRRAEWSPDSKAVIAWRIEPGDRKQVHLIRSAPDGGGRAQLESRAYDLPGDKFSRHEPNVFDVASRKQIKPAVDRFEHGWLSPQVRWSRDGGRFRYLQVDRGHQRLRVIEVDARTGANRNLIDEQSNTFIWTVHTENLRLELVNWMEKTDEIIYVSEQDGWRHLYLVNGAPVSAPARSESGGQQRAGSETGAPPLRQITKGEWVVRGIEQIDEDARQIWFSAGGRNSKEDPYFLHHYRVNFDGSGLTALTGGNGNHSIEFSPDRKYIIDTWSRADAPPVNELRRVSDGKLVCRLEAADLTELKAGGWKPPEVFVAKGRDHRTDIWGLIHRPRDFNPAKKYPVIESIYAGPQGSFVPKSFSGGNRFASLTDLGFVVVQIDGMGTANRSKAFHDVCFKNLKDGGFADRILWMKAAAAKHPELDISRVGVYGNSAGGQNAAAAVLFHPEFYKAAVASCGCHDNRMDKASWNEQWMGYLPPDKMWRNEPDNWYSQCSNIENAHRLQGKLFLIVGEMDNNVPPESTMRFADALVKAGKDFDLLVIPGGGHGMGGTYGQRRMEDFFVRNLLGKEPPHRNAPAESPAGS